jgi:hypothetical protein
MDFGWAACSSESSQIRGPQPGVLQMPARRTHQDRSPRAERWTQPNPLCIRIAVQVAARMERLPRSGIVLRMNLLLVMVVLLLLLGGGGFYWGGPAYGGGGIGLILLICLIIFLAGGFRRRV